MKHVLQIIGQERAKAQIQQLFNSELCGGFIRGPIRPILAYGPSGTGKSHLISQVIKDLAEIGIPTTRIEDCASIALQSGPGVKRVIDTMNASAFEPRTLVLDEVQRVLKNGGTSAMGRDLGQFLFCHGEEDVKPYVTGNIAGDSVSVNFHNLIIIAATNENCALETTESRRNDQTPIARRFSAVELENYSQGEMDEIIPSYFGKMGYRIHDSACGLVRRLHRGNMEALTEVGRRIRGSVNPEKGSVNKEEILQACRLTKFLPRGLKRAEGLLLERLALQDLPRTRAEGICRIWGKQFDSTLNHLTSQFHDDGRHLPMVAQVGQKYRATEFGKRFITEVKKEGFTLE